MTRLHTIVNRYEVSLIEQMSCEPQVAKVCIYCYGPLSKQRSTQWMCTVFAPPELVRLTAKNIVMVGILDRHCRLERWELIIYPPKQYKVWTSIAVTDFLLACYVYVPASLITFSKNTLRTPLVSSTSGQSNEGWFCNTLNIITQNFTVAFAPPLSKPLPPLLRSRHYFRNVKKYRPTHIPTPNSNVEYCCKNWKFCLGCLDYSSKQEAEAMEAFPCHIIEIDMFLYCYYLYLILEWLFLHWCMLLLHPLFSWSLSEYVPLKLE